MAGEQEILGPEAQYHAFLREGRFMIQRTKSDGQYVFYPRVANPTNGDDALEWVEASGRGVVYATTSTSRRPEQGGDYNIALVDLEEGPPHDGTGGRYRSRRRGDWHGGASPYR